MLESIKDTDPDNWEEVSPECIAVENELFLADMHWEVDEEELDHTMSSFYL